MCVRVSVVVSLSLSLSLCACVIVCLYPLSLCFNILCLSVAVSPSPTLSLLCLGEVSGGGFGVPHEFYICVSEELCVTGLAYAAAKKQAWCRYVDPATWIASCWPCRATAPSVHGKWRSAIRTARGRRTHGCGFPLKGIP